jgi:hypothetical protein
MNLRSSPTTGQLRAIGKLFSSDGIRKLKLKSSQIVKPGQRSMDGGVPLPHAGPDLYGDLGAVNGSQSFVYFGFRRRLLRSIRSSNSEYKAVQFGISSRVEHGD